jgi:hypothetical protein
VTFPGSIATTSRPADSSLSNSGSRTITPNREKTKTLPAHAEEGLLNAALSSYQLSCLGSFRTRLMGGRLESELWFRV